MSLPQSKLTDEQRAEVITRRDLGEPMAAMAKTFGVSITTISKICKKAGVNRPIQKDRLVAPAKSVTEFAKRARSILWRQDSGSIRKTYDQWEAKVKDLEVNGGMNPKQAIVQASKDFARLEILFREFDVSEYDPHPDSHPRIQKHGQPEPVENIECEDKEQSHRENLIWAIEAAGKKLRTGESPISAPNDAAYYLYCQARNEPKDFLGKFTQVEAKSSSDSDEDRDNRKRGKRSVDEIEEMLQSLTEGSNLEKLP